MIYKGFKMPVKLFETTDLLAVDKPAGLASIPERNTAKDSLLSVLSASIGQKLYVVHRLDKDVSGVILFAKNADMHRHLNEQFANRAVKKTYLALAHGRLEQNNGVIDKPLRAFGSGRIAVDPVRGKPSVTEYAVVERIGAYTLVKAMPLTGRRHQIRAHLFHLGHPLVGDPRYGDNRLQKHFSRLMLHARRIEFTLPDDAVISVAAPLPESFTALLEMLRETA
ncbi:MAG: RluA family pseudouridine synthase [Candidatus Competibacteraceae bacterium]|nr:RluA family pseudouridine synthase [Candidatus Competibacteraceae bacterium]